MGRRRLGVILFAGGVAAMGGIGVAGATLQQSGLKCSGSAIVTAPDGSIATIRAEDKEVDLPAEGVAR